jgi:hypothetical protein
MSAWLNLIEYDARYSSHWAEAEQLAAALRGKIFCATLRAVEVTFPSIGKPIKLIKAWRELCRQFR